MTFSIASPAAVRPGAAPVELPLRIKVLFITTPERTGSWLAEAFAADGAAQVVLKQVVGVTTGLARLRDEAFDAVLVSHAPSELDALEFVEALRAGGSDEALLILGSQPPQQLDALCYEAGADDYCCVDETTVRGLLWKFARAIQRSHLTRENRRLVQAERQRLQQEHHEAERLLDQQRALIEDLQELSSSAVATDPSGPLPLVERAMEGGRAEDIHYLSHEPPDAEALIDLPPPLVDHYRELLRTYVIMGAGNLSQEMGALATLLAESNLSAQRAIQLHVQVLEELVQGLGNRSARHVMNRADLLALEVMGHLADRYRQRYHERRCPRRQQILPGFEVAA
jgi:DNA-binding response OmpR family regulator